MSSGTTPLRGRPYPLETDTPDAAADMHSLALALDTAPVVTQGTLASRPAASAAGNRYYVTGDATLINNGIEWLDTGSSWAQITQAPPIGAINMWGGSADPADTRWLVCDGRAISRTTYATLFGIYGVTFGAGDGSTTFNIPAFGGRVPGGVGSMTDTEGNTGSYSLGQKIGVFSHVLSVPEMPAHNHPGSTVGAPARAFQQGAAGAEANDLASSSAGTVVVATQGGSGSHTNIQPTLGINFIVRVS